MDAEERNGPAYFMQNRPHVRLEARVQHVLSSPIAPVGVVPWKPLVCAFVQPSIQCHTHARKKRREGERERGEEKKESASQRERDERTLRGSPQESFFPERVGGVLCHTPVCISNRVR